MHRVTVDRSRVLIVDAKAKGGQLLSKLAALAE